MLVSIIIRTLNEELYLDELLLAIGRQASERFNVEVVLVDSGSEDNTLKIAKRHGCRIVTINRQDFSFGRSLNMGCEVAHGQILIAISGHCVPVDECWLESLCSPIADEAAVYTYGKQMGSEYSRYGERRVFEKYYADLSAVPQDGFFCNNANAALDRNVWLGNRFDEELTGLEDMALAKKLTSQGLKIGYVSEACVYHHHDETWGEITRRFERESIALQSIMPQVHIRKRDLVRYIFTSIWFDSKTALKERVFWGKCIEILVYRCCQYWGSYKGNHDQRRLSFAEKEKYFFPKPKVVEK
ncbi:MAG: glycosyltransferase family 2 protein [Gammaproteobacteria bacterium]|jgi:Glycosyltransferases, probably involved in cell wall biogenesis